MATTHNPEFIYKQIERHGWTNFRVKGADQRQIAMHDTTDGETQQTINLLKEVIENNAGTLNIKIYQKPTSVPNAKGSPKNYLEYTLNNSPGDITPVNGAQTQSHDADVYAEREARLRMEFDHKLERLEWERKLKEAEEKSPYDQYLGQLITGILPLFSKQAPAVAGINEPAPENLPDERGRIEAAITKLMNLDPDFCQNIEKLAEIATKSPDVYKMAINSLNNF